MNLFWSDQEFQTQLTVFICRDQNFLKQCAHLLDADDFKPRKSGEPLEIWIVASKALEFWHKYREPIVSAGMLRTEMLDYCRQANVGEKQKERILSLVAHIKKGNKLVAVDALAEKVISYKKERMKKASIQQLVELQEQGKLTDERWMETCYEALRNFGKFGYSATDYFAGIEDRIKRRSFGESHHKFPYLLIDPLDERIKGIGRGHLGLWLAYLGTGKSLALNWVSLSYVLQGLNVLHFTLEDPREEVENRFDACVTSLPTRRLYEMPIKLRRRFALFTRLLRSKLKIVDKTEDGVSVSQIEEIWDQERNRGFTADAIIVDYDDEIIPPRRHKGESARRFEFADIYRDLRRVASRRNVIMWTAAQTGRKTEGQKIITSAATAEDISKVRKATLAIGIGQGDWGKNSRYLYVAKHKFDQQFVGCNIMGDFDRTVFFDRAATLREIDAAKEEHKKEELGDE